MASLLERMNVDSPAGVGPVRSKTRRAGSAPYTRPPKGDINSTWKHDMYQQGSEAGKSLSDRLDAPSRDTPPKMNFGGAVKALKEATGLGADKELSIRGASTRGNVVEVTGLVKGTTAEDVEVSNSKIRFLLFEEWGNKDNFGWQVRFVTKLSDGIWFASPALAFHSLIKKVITERNCAGHL
jgi:hypothetical protein